MKIIEIGITEYRKNQNEFLNFIVKILLKERKIII